MENNIKVVANLNLPQWRETQRRIYSIYGVSPTFHGIGMGGNTEPKILVRRQKNGKQNKTSVGVANKSTGQY